MQLKHNGCFCGRYNRLDKQCDKRKNSVRHSRLQKLGIDVTRKVRHSQWNRGEPSVGTLKIGPHGPQCKQYNLKN